MLLYHLIEKRILLGYLGAQRIPEHSTDSLKAYSEGRVPASFQFFFFFVALLIGPQQSAATELPYVLWLQSFLEGNKQKIF